MGENDAEVGDTKRSHLFDWFRNKVRAWLLTPRERDIVEQTEELSTEIKSVESEWRGIKQALEKADVWDGETELESVDILVVAGRDHIIQGARFGDSIHLTSAQNVTVQNCTVVPDK